MASPLVDVPWLELHANDPDVRIVDVRWYLRGSGKDGATEYARGHLPGASFVDLDGELADPQASSPGRHPLPRLASFAALLARLGVTEKTTVVGYDDAGGSVAARLWWLLRYVGHDGGRVLDGGIQAWTSSALPLSTEAPSIEPAAPMDLRAPAAFLVDKAEVARLRANTETLLLDARALERFEGKVEPIDARPGRIPGARSAPFAQNLEGPGGRFRSVEALRAHYEGLGVGTARRIVCYCGSGVTACHDLLALSLVGRADALLYEGSYSDWARDPALPVAIGEEAAAIEKSQDKGSETE